ncbi:hypothetical protein EV368DRAFT_76590 [Lentinula lateritia]|nr:hypothetical protein EV368DRAFT_76590 [Lentinula lateritia]
MDFDDSMASSIADPTMAAQDSDNSDEEPDLPPNKIAVDLRDFISLNKWKGGYRKYKDSRTWGQRIRRFNAAWEPLIEELADSYTGWKYKSYAPLTPNPEYEFSISVVDIYTLERSTRITRDENTNSSKALVQAGYLGTSPEQPSLAVSLRTLELFYTLRLFKPNLSVEAFAKSICYLYSMPYRCGYRTALSDTFDIYLAIKRKIDARVAKELGHDDPNYRVLHSCPCCNYELNDEVELEISRLFAGDGNNSLKRIRGIGSRQIADLRVFADSDYYLTEEYVNTFAHEVQARPSAKVTEDVIHEDSWVDEVHGDPTDGEPTPSLQQCTDNWKATAADSLKRMWDAFHESGWYVSACRHGFILWVADMIRSGELAKYPLSIVAKALEVFGNRWVMGYDIGCSFETTVRNSSLGPEFERKQCRTCVNAFHGYSHNSTCQQKYHPLSIRGTGLEDLETLERFFSSSNQLASITRYMSSYRRRVFIDMFLQQWDREKYHNLATMLHNNYIQALNILQNEEPAYRADLATLGLTEEDLDAYQTSEFEHLKSLGTEHEGDVFAAAYVELLQDYRKARRDQLLFEVIQMETAMGISRRWEVADREYIEGLELISTRKYRQALEHLHKLVVQRLFELHKMNLSNTGYKMRTHISHALQRRSNTIRTAVKAYNTAALALNPPRDTLDWSKVSHYAFLDQFNILSDTRHSVFEQPWARPVNRTLMKQRRQIQHAREEIIRCNTELRRLHTSIVDENRQFSVILLNLHGSLIYGPVSEFIERRQAINQLLLSRIYQTYELEGYTGERTVGVCKGSVNSHSLNPPITSPEYGDSGAMQVDPSPQLLDLSTAQHTSAANAESSDEGEDGDDDEFTEGLGAVMDFMSNISLQ